MAVKVTDVLSLYTSVQSEPQLTPVPVTVPEPVPDLDTVRVRCVKAKAALTDLFAVMVTVHVLQFVESQPVQPLNEE